VPRTSAGPQALHLPLGVGRRHRGSPEAQKLSPDFRPRYCGAGVSHVLGPSTIELYPLFVGEREFSLPLHVGKALPKRHRKFSTIAGRQFQELRKRAGFHGVILSRRVSCGNRFGSCVTCVVDRPLAWPSRIADMGRLLVQRSRHDGCHGFCAALSRRPPARAPHWVGGLLGGEWIERVAEADHQKRAAAAEVSNCPDTRVAASRARCSRGAT